MSVKISQFEDHRSASEQDVMHFEMGLAAVLPTDYRDFLLRHNGGFPEPCGFLGGNESVNSIFGFCQKHYCLLCHFHMLRAVLPAAVIPIADDGCGNMICLSVSKANHGQVFFWDHETGANGRLTCIAMSFTSFLDSLCELPSLDET